jgi:hypothetical protein
MSFFVRFALVAALSLGTLPSTGSTLTDQVLEQLLERHLPEKVYEKADNPWPGGSYTLTAFKNGTPTVVSKADSVRVSMPLNIVMTGDASATWLRLSMSCKSNFSTTGEVLFTPRVTGDTLTLDAQITLPIPPVTANCDKMQIPVQDTLRALVAQYKQQWEQRVASEANGWLTSESARR